jgi:hypothetical protein
VQSVKKFTFCTFPFNLLPIGVQENYFFAVLVLTSLTFYQVE